MSFKIGRSSRTGWLFLFVRCSPHRPHRVQARFGSGSCLPNLSFASFTVCLEQPRMSPLARQATRLVQVQGCASLEKELQPENSIPGLTASAGISMRSHRIAVFRSFGADRRRVVGSNYSSRLSLFSIQKGKSVWNYQGHRGEPLRVTRSFHRSLFLSDE